MNLNEAITHVINGGRATSNSLLAGEYIVQVVIQNKLRIMVYNPHIVRLLPFNICPEDLKDNWKEV